jgi:2-keto-3-deoxy-L-rhamnonate aldolase RhmA
VRHAAHFGFDCIWLDLEHRLIPDQQLQTLLAHFHLADVDCMLRPPTLEKTRLYRYLEDGAAGLLIPHVSTAEKAQMLVEAVKFPPLGDRGLDGAGFDGDFYLDDRAAYVDAANRETFLVVQIETPQAVENVDAIAAVEGVDGLFIGPGDLGMRIARASHTSLSLESAQRRVAEAAAQHGKGWGLPVADEVKLRQALDAGAQLIAFGSEYHAQMQMFEQIARAMDEIYPSGT